MFRYGKIANRDCDGCGEGLQVLTLAPGARYLCPACHPDTIGATTMNETTTRCNRCDSPLTGHEQRGDTCNRCLDLGYASLTDEQYDALNKERHEMTETTTQITWTLDSASDAYVGTIEDRHVATVKPIGFPQVRQWLLTMSNKQAAARHTRTSRKQAMNAAEGIVREWQAAGIIAAALLCLLTTLPSDCAISGTTGEGFPVATCADGSRVYRDDDGQTHPGAPYVETGTWVPMSATSPVFPERTN